MMKVETRRRLVAAGLGMSLSVLGACGDYLTVPNPNVVDGNEVDPVADAPVLAASAQQDFAFAYGRFVVNGALYTGQLISSDINMSGNLMALRQVDPTLGTLNSALFAPLSRARAAGDRVLSALAGTESEQSIHSARAALFAGYSLVLLAESFCQGTIDGGPPLTAAELLDEAVARLTRAIEIGQAVGTDAALVFVDAARVGRARAHLQAGRNAEAAADAEAVSTGFSFDLEYADDLANRSRLGNYVWSETFDPTNLSVAQPFRDLNDPRVVVLPPDEHSLTANDGITEIWLATKYQSYSAPIRLASELEADYVAAEANGTTAMLNLIQARRTANGQPAYTGPEDDQSVLEEFIQQRTRDFFLEGKGMSDYRRHPDALLHLQPAGAPYHKPPHIYSDQACWPLPFRETSSNPNFGG